LSATVQDVLEGRARWAVAHQDNREVIPNLPDQSVGLLLSDPPYAISNEGMWHVGRPGKGKRRFDFFEGDADWGGMVDSVVALIESALPKLTPTASAYLWVGHREFGPLVDLFEASGFKTRFLVWAKAAPSPPPPGSGWPSGAELCVYAYKPGRTWNHDGRRPPPNSVLVADSFRHGQPGATGHPTQKPLAVIDPLIFASASTGTVVLDPWCGSASIGVSALRAGCRYVGCERDPNYAEVARQRLQAESQGLSLRDFRAGQLPMFGDSG
jgi:DNA modification methylase